MALAAALLTTPAGALDAPKSLPPKSPAEISVDKTGSEELPPVADPDREAARRLLAPLRAECSDVVGDGRWDSEARIITVDVVARDPRADDFKSAALALPLAVGVEFQEVAYSKQFLESLATELVETAPEWASGLTLYGIATPTAEGRLEFDVPAEEVEAWNRLVESTKLAVPVEVQPGGPVVLESRQSDAPPWIGGLAVDGIDSGWVGLCTSGYLWRIWGSNAQALSIAEHCVNPRHPTDHNGPYTNWWNGSSFVGTVVVTAPKVDTALFRSAYQTYSPKVFVGGVNTSDKRWVTSYVGDPDLSDEVAFSGRISGLDSSWVYHVGYITPYAGKALRLILTTGHITDKGDSGGPWLTTQSGSGNVIAHGVHHGNVPHGGARRSAYVTVLDVSANAQASLVFGP